MVAYPNNNIIVSRPFSTFFRLRPETATAKYLYTGMKAHMEMEKLMNLGFAEHPEILPKLFHHIFEAFVSRSDHEALQDAFDK